MQRANLSHRLATFTFLLVMGGCTLGNNTLADQPEAKTLDQSADKQTTATFSSPLSYQVYNLMAAEMYARSKNTAQAALHYVAAAEQSADPAVAKRAAELSITAEDNTLTQKALSRWLLLDPNAVDAYQYRALLNLRTEHYDDAVKDLVVVRDNIEKKEGHGFELIVSLLAMEPQPKKSYETFKRYVAQVDSGVAAQLVLASMAINNDQFDEALKAAAIVKQQGNARQKLQGARLTAKALMNQKRVPEALAELKPLIKNSKDTELKLDYARMLIMADRRSEATPLFKQLYTSQPENLDILYTLGLLHLEQKEYDFAEPLLKKLADNPSRAAEANYFLGQIYEGKKKPQEALVAYQKALGSNFTADAISRSTQLLMNQKGAEETRKWLHTQLAKAPTLDRKVHLLRAEGQLLHDQQRYKEAIAVFDQVLKMRADDNDTLYLRALSHEKIGEFPAAESDLRTVLKQRADDVTVLNGLGYMLAVNTSRYVEAEQLIRRALELRPNDAAVLDSMGWVMYRMGKPKDAEEWLRKAYAQVQEPEIASHLAEVLSANGKNAEAKSLVQEMLTKFPNDQLLLKVKEKIAAL